MGSFQDQYDPEMSRVQRIRSNEESGLTGYKPCLLQTRMACRGVDSVLASTSGSSNQVVIPYLQSSVKKKTGEKGIVWSYAKSV